MFTRTKHGANKLSKQLGLDGINAEAIHGNKTQNNRQRALEGFRSGRVQVLVATDIAARGLDIEQLPNVVNFDLPNVPEDYVHRIGRTARAGASGHSHSLVSADEAPQLYAIERLIRSELPQHELEGFEPVHTLPERGSRGSVAGRPAGNSRNRSSQRQRQGPRQGPRQGQRQGQGHKGQRRGRGSSRR
mgnify:FL=1